MMTLNDFALIINKLIDSLSWVLKMKNAFKALFYQLRLKLQSSQGNNKEHINGLIYSKAPKTLFSTVKIVYA